MKIFLDGLFGARVDGLHKAMELTAKRQDAIASNIANAETPGYRATDVDFAGELDRAFAKQSAPIRTTDPKHMDIGEGGVARFVNDLSGSTKPDGNNVDIDIQMGQMNRNKAQYSNAATFMRASLAFIGNIVRQNQ